MKLQDLVLLFVKYIILLPKYVWSLLKEKSADLPLSSILPT